MINTDIKFQQLCPTMTLLSLKRRQLKNREPVWVNKCKTTNEEVLHNHK